MVSIADRTVSVTLRAQVSDYLAGMEKARKATSETGSEAEKLAQKREAFDLLGKASLAMGVAAAAGVVLAVAKFAEFDQAMSNVNAATIDASESTAETAARMDALGAAALEAGASTVFSATESANAIEELAKAGLSTSDILGGALKGSLDLAAAGQLGVARAAEISATALQQFKLDGSEAGHVADVLSAGAGKAMGSVEDLANGLKFVGPVANSMGVSLETTTGVLAMFAQQGIIGEQAGTSLRGVLASLTSPSSLARKEIEKLGITLYDANGKFLGLENAAGELSKAYTGMDDASRNASMGIIFGRETITAATTLYQEGAEGVAEWTSAVDDSGYAAEVARARLDNLAGDVEALGGAFDTALIQTGAAGNDVLRAMTQTLTDVIDLYNEAPEPVKAAALATLAVAAAAGLAGAAFFLGAPKVAAFNVALATMGPNAQKAGAALTASAGPIGIALAAAGVALAIFAGAQADAKARTDAFSDTLEAQTGQITKSTRELAAAGLAAKDTFLWFESDSTYDAAKKLGIELETVTEAALGNADAMAAVNEALDVGTLGSKEHKKALEDSGLTLSEYNLAQIAVTEGIKGSSESLEEAIRVEKQKADADAEAEVAALEHASALDVLEGKAADTGESVDDLAAAIRGFGSAALSSRDAARALEESYDTLEQSIKDNGKSLDITSEAGRANEAALDGVAKAALESAAATLEQTGSQEKANGVMASGRAQLIKMLGQFGITGAAAEAYADKLGLAPDYIDTTARLFTDGAQTALDGFIQRNNGRTITLRSTTQNAPVATIQANGSVLDFYANGGMRENHTAQIAPAGAWRVWAEPETGGEAYIPLAASKRARSLDIWEETGRRLGVAGFANGGIQYASNAGARAASGGSTSFNVVVSSKGGVDLLRYVDVQIQQAGNQSELKMIRGRQR